MEILSPTVRLIIFGGEFLVLVVVSIWFILARSGRTALIYQLLAGIGALVTLPAVIVSVINLMGSASIGPLVTGVSILALIGFLLTGVAVALALTTGDSQPRAAASPPSQPIMAMDRTSVPLYPAAPEPAPLEMASPSGATVVSGAIAEQAEASAATVVGGPAADLNRTVVAGSIGRASGRLAYLIERSAEGRPHRLVAEEILIGRGHEAHIVLNDPQVSREHLKLKLEQRRFVAYDLGGTNGTVLMRDGEQRRLTEPTPLIDGDILYLGPQTHLVYLDVVD